MECGEGEIKGSFVFKLHRTTFNGYTECMYNSITVGVMMRWWDGCRYGSKEVVL
jgi:hypothetical protein